MHATNETLRKLLHIAVGGGIVLLRWIPWWAAAGAAVIGILGNRLLLHRLLGRSVSRDERGYDAGIVLYPLSVLLLVVIFRERLEYAAIAWALLAFGDGMATMAGRLMPRGRLPWNPQKSWAGFVAFLVFGGAGAVAAGAWMGFHGLVAILIATVAAAVAESLPLGVDDNLTVPFAAAVALAVFGVEVLSPYGVWPSTPQWLVVNGLLAIAGFYARSVSFSGAVGGWALGTIIILGAGWPMYVALLVFFVIGTGATKLGYRKKAALGLAEERGGRRGFSHAFANAGVAAICAIAVSRFARSALAGSEIELLPLLMGIASLATAAADTTASEIGQLRGKRAFLPLTLRRVPVGTEGAISVEGTVAGALAGLAVSAAGIMAADALFFEAVFSWQLLAALGASAFLGSYAESVAGAWNRKRGSPVPNGVLNFFNTAVGALIFFFLQDALGLFDWDSILPWMA